MTRFCALCRAPLTKPNNSNEHIIPNAIGGRKKMRNFLCKRCNNDTGRKWDNELCDQLKPFCTMLGVKRQKGENQPVPIKGSNGKEFILNTDASISIPHTIRREHALADKTEVIIETSSIKKAKRILAQEVAARCDRTDLDVEKILSNAAFPRNHIQAPLRMSLPLFLSGQGAGRSIVKSCLALAYQAGLSVNDCEYARRYLEETGDACFGHYNKTDLVKNRPTGICFHSVCVSGDPTTGLVLGYVEYFSYQRIIARLSDNYHGDAFVTCYAIDPMSGEELDLDVALNFSSDAIPAILANRKVDEGKVEDCLKSLLGMCFKNLMITNVIENANEKCGFKSTQSLSGEQFEKWSNIVADGLARAFLGVSDNHPLSPRGGDASDKDLTS